MEDATPVWTVECQHVQVDRLILPIILFFLMKITVNVEDFVDKIETDLVEYDKTYKKTIIAYQKKHAEYNEYLKKELDKLKDGEDAMEKLKPAPQFPYWRRDTYANHLRALKANTTTSIEIDANEYNNIQGGLELANIEIGSSFASMVSLNY